MGKLYRKLEQYTKEDYYPYHMPGHKRHLYGSLPKEMIQNDITEIDGFDNLHQPEEILLELQKKAAKFYGAEESFYLVNGSTCGILSAISAALPKGGHLLMARNSHKSAYHAVYLRCLTVSYLYPKVIKEYDICDVITPGQVKAALEAEPDIEAVYVVSPTYEGRIADIAGIAQVVHEKGIPLIVDEAHGAHLGLMESSLSNDKMQQDVIDFHANSCQLGADIVIHSVHKTLPSMTQTALLHVNGNLIDRDKLRRFLHIYQSSSPSYILMASIDNALQLVEEQGKELFSSLKENYLEMLEKLADCQYLKFLPMDASQDIGKLIISTKKAGISGQDMYDILLKKYHLQLEMASESYCLAMFTIGDTKEAYDRMSRALLTIDQDIAEGRLRTKKRSIDSAYKERMVPYAYDSELIVTSDAIPFAKAWDKAYELIPLKDAVGRHIAEFVNLYPPGVPILVPGEVLQESVCQQILQYISQKLTVQGVTNTEPYLVKVLQ